MESFLEILEERNVCPNEVSGQKKLYYDLLFSAKYVNGLSKILQGGMNLSAARNGFSAAPPDLDAQEKIKAEFHANILRFTELLKDFLKYTDEPTRREIQQKYLSLSQQSMVNLNSLIYDLSWLKKYYNSLRQ